MPTHTDIADLRITYRRATLSESDIDTDPIVQFATWLDEAIAADALEPTAMTLATVDAAGRVGARVVLLKALDRAGAPATASGRGFVWYTNYDSRKGHDLAAHATAALCFFWPELERQVRIEGRVEQASAAESDAYFASRPFASRVGAAASPQSQVIPSRERIETAETALAAQYAADPASLPRPPHWGGYRLVPDTIEFWQGRPSRLHDRLVYRSDATADHGWRIERLAP
jgi:pyridoxamine 5'-phosphate oxidase